MQNPQFGDPALAVALVGGQDARALGARLLNYLVAVLMARGGAVLAFYRGRLFWFAEQLGGDVSKLDEAKRTWDATVGKLARVETVACGTDGSLCPLIADGELVGAVFLDGVLPAVADIGVVADLLAAAIQAPPAVHVAHEQAIRDLSEDDFERRRTLLLLHENEWNIARVARLMNCQRRTIYLRLERWGVTREKVRKSPPTSHPATA